MDGVLLKWTNYFSGWQPRYFILEDGILSYYQSKADMNNSCKGSIKVSACDITAHPNDHTRMDIIVPGEACYYVKAATQQDRQMWLVALGTCKARSYNSAPRFPDSSSMANRNDECLAGEELLKIKKSELVMYRDLLTQQLYNIKMTLKTDKPPNIELLNEASALVNVTCESFIGTLEDCMQLVDLNSCLNSKEGSLSPISKSKQFSYKESSWGSQPMTRHVSQNDRRSTSSRSISEEKEMNPSIIHSRNRIVSESRSPSDHLQPISLTSPKPQPKLSPVPSFTPDVSDGVFTTDGESVVNGYGDKSTSVGVRDLSPDRRLPTFFSRVKMSFLDVKLTSEMEIPTIPFLDACRSVVSIFDKLNEQAFVIGKLDIAGNIRKIHQKYISSPESFPTIEQMVRMEIKRKENENVNSATVALLWLCKSLEFCTKLMSRLLTYDCDIEAEEMRKVVREVYEKVLKNHHGWVVRSAFYMILPSLPPLSQMISTLSVEPSHSENPDFKASLKLDVIDYLSGLRSIVDILHSFFDINGLTISDNTD